MNISNMTSSTDTHLWLFANLMGDRYLRQQLHQRISDSFDTTLAYPTDLHPKKQCYASAEQLIEEHLIWEKKSKDHSIITPSHQYYPPLLKTIHNPPLTLFCMGNTQLLIQPQLAMVGSRKPTPMGKEIAFTFANQLSHHRLIVTSGMALGIDAACHRGALHNQHATIAVLGTGIDRCYPSQHQHLAKEIRKNGLILSEFALGTPPLAQHFPRRNRIVSGLCLGTLVVEATRHSGSLITAKFAADQGRDVFAVPSTIHNPQASGCHYLLQQGAKLASCAEDIIDEFPQFDNAANPIKQNQPNLDEKLSLAAIDRKLLQCIPVEGIGFDGLLQQSQLAADELHPRLLKLALSGHIYSNITGYYRVK